SSRRRHTICYRDWSSDVCSSDLVILMHMRGTPDTMDSLATYRHVAAEVAAELDAAARRAEQGGVARERIVVDPGFGFAKQPEQKIGRASCRERGESAVEADDVRR